MIIYLLKMFGISLVLTVVIELLIAYFLCKPITREKVRLVVLVNVLTNPAAVLVVWVLRLFVSNGLGFVLQIPVEALVILAEAGVYLKFSKVKGWDIARPIRLAVVANMVSWLAGMLLQLLR